LFSPRQLPPLRPDAASDLDRYRNWLAERDALVMGGPEGDGDALLPAGRTDVLLCLDHPVADLLRACVRSVVAQTHASWRLCAVQIGDVEVDCAQALHDELARAPSDHVIRLSVPEGTPQVEAMAVAFDNTSSATVLLLGQHDELAEDTLSLLGIALEADPSVRADVAYGDEDRFDRDGMPVHPILKPGWSPDLLLSTPYLGRPVLMRRSVINEVGGFRPLEDGDWEHDLHLRVTERAERVAQVAEVLCHRPVEDDTTGDETAAGSRAVIEALERRREIAEISVGPLPKSFTVRRAPESTPLVSVVIPFRDGAQFLRVCCDSVSATAEGVELELILVDNGSEEPETRTLLDHLSERPDVTVVSDPSPFNWAALNNDAISACNGEILVFLNNDIEATSPGWLSVMAGNALRPEVGVVGARLLYPTRRIQHVGVVVGLGGAAGHVLAGLSAEEPGYLGMALLGRDCSAVTGACLATRREVFDELGGFDETLGLDLNDIDYCLRAIQEGYRVTFEPLAELIHYESPSRGTSGSVSDILRFIQRWENLIALGDPHLNPHLTRLDSSCALRAPDEEEWWQNWRSTLERS